MEQAQDVIDRISYNQIRKQRRAKAKARAKMLAEAREELQLRAGAKEAFDQCAAVVAEALGADLSDAVGNTER
eukprot:4938901-Alexandrium_andersonii.AAC.1